MRTLHKSAGPIVVVLLLSGCAGRAPASLSPVGVLTWQANEAVLLLNMIQQRAIDLNALEACEADTCRPRLSDGITRRVIEARAAAVRSIAQTPDGWLAASSQVLIELQTYLRASDDTTAQNIAPWIDLVLVTLKEL